MSHTRKNPDQPVIALVPLGTTPSIAIQFLWALNDRKIVRRGELRIVTTTRGYEAAKKLFAINTLTRLNEEYGTEWTWYGTDSPNFSKKVIERLHYQGSQKIADLTDEQSVVGASVDLISMIEPMINKPTLPPLYVLNSGGRASMTAIVHQIMSLCARDCDRLFELPANEEAMDNDMSKKRRDWQQVWTHPSEHDDTQSIARHFTLIENPFLRLRDRIPNANPDDTAHEKDSVSPVANLFRYQIAHTQKDIDRLKSHDYVMVLTAPKSTAPGLCGLYFIPSRQVEKFASQWPNPDIDRHCYVHQADKKQHVLQLKAASLWLFLLVFANSRHSDVARSKPFRLQAPHEQAGNLAVIYQRLSQKRQPLTEEHFITLFSALGITVNIPNTWPGEPDRVKSVIDEYNKLDDQIKSKISATDFSIFLEPQCRWPTWITHSVTELVDTKNTDLITAITHAQAEQWSKFLRNIRSRYKKITVPVIKTSPDTPDWGQLFDQFLPSNIKLGQNGTLYCGTDPRRVYFIDTDGLMHSAETFDPDSPDPVSNVNSCVPDGQPKTTKTEHPAEQDKLDVQRKVVSWIREYEWRKTLTDLAGKDTFDESPGGNTKWQQTLSRS